MGRCGSLIIHAVMAAEVVHHFLPKLVELHNYPPANSVSQKLENWRTLNSELCSVCRSMSQDHNILNSERDAYRLYHQITIFIQQRLLLEDKILQFFMHVNCTHH